MYLVSHWSSLYFTGSVCTGRRALPVQWCEHDGLQNPQHGEQPGGLHYWEVVHGTTSGSTQTWLWSTGRLHDRECHWQNEWLNNLWMNESLCPACSQSVVIRLSWSLWTHSVQQRLCDISPWSILMRLCRPIPIYSFTSADYKEI